MGLRGVRKSGQTWAKCRGNLIFLAVHWRVSLMEMPPLSKAECTWPEMVNNKSSFTPEAHLKLLLFALS